LAREVVVVDPAEADEPPPPQAAKTTVARAATMNPKRVIQGDVRRCPEKDLGHRLGSP